MRRRYYKDHWVRRGCSGWVGQVQGLSSGQHESVGFSSSCNAPSTRHRLRWGLAWMSPVEDGPLSLLLIRKGRSKYPQGLLPVLQRGCLSLLGASPPGVCLTASRKPSLLITLIRFLYPSNPSMCSCHRCLLCSTKMEIYLLICSILTQCCNHPQRGGEGWKEMESWGCTIRAQLSGHWK